MKKYTKLLGIVLIIALVLSMGIAAFADSTITVSNADPTTDENSATETYTAYKIFDAVKSTGTTVTTTDTTQSLSEGGAITYQIKTSDPWFSVLFKNDGTASSTAQKWFTATKIHGMTPETWQVIPTETTMKLTDAKTIADWLLENKGNIIGSPLEVGKANTVDDGYYLVTSSLGANLGLATTDIPMTIVEKNTYPSIDKKQNDAENTTHSYTDDDVDVQVGDTINYQVVVWVPATANDDLTVTDVMSAGLDKADPFAVTVKVADPETGGGAPDSFTTELAATKTVDSVTVTNYTIDTSADRGWTVVIKPTADTLGKFVEFTFDAVVNSSAITDSVKNNKVELTYSNYKQTDFVEYNIYAVGVVKYDGKNNTVNPDTTTNALQTSNVDYLSGAEFLLLDKDGSTEIKVSYNITDDYYYPDANGTATITSVNTATGIVIRGLDNQDYFLKETKAPDGYNLITGNIKLTVAEDELTATTTGQGTEQTTTYSLTDVPELSIVKVANEKGTVLPSTGGIGTTIFYVVGSVLVIAAAVLLITKKRMDRD